MFYILQDLVSGSAYPCHYAEQLLGSVQICWLDGLGDVMCYNTDRSLEVFTDD